MNQDSVSKLTATKNVIRNKFEKAQAIRLENEHNVNDGMKYLITTSESKNNDLSTTNNSAQLHLKTNEKQHNRDPNTLCAILKILLASSSDSDTERMQQISAILNELRELEIII